MLIANNKWDLCKVFAPDDQLDTDCDSDDSIYDPYILSLFLPDDDPLYLPNHNKGLSLSASDLQ
jgi:hypothetical protein